MQVIVILSLCWATKATQNTKPVPSEAYLLHEVLDHDGKFHVFWKFNATHITFELHVKTRGYVGFGISPNGKMYPSDVVIGWVKDGITHFSDRHTIGHVQPVIDQSQDWILLHGEENDFGTMLKFERAMVTCDNNDTDIVDDTMRMIYSYHPDDPIDDDHLQWHGATRRGAKSMLLLSTSKQYKLPDDIQTKDLVHNNFHIPTKRTTYHCKIFSLEDITTKHHMVKFEAWIQKGHEPFVHHMNVYKCRKPRKYIGREYECYHLPIRDMDLVPCGNVVAGWAVGSGPFHFPDHIGLPLGENEKEFVYILEVHYNNPGAVSGLVDNSGMRFTYTSHLRQDDAGVLTIGARERKSQIIPPHYSDFRSIAVASEECLSSAFNDSGRQEVKMFAIWQHAHLIGRAIKTRHMRGDVELKPIAIDNHYDFDYQETRLLKGEVPLRQGDSIRVECTYNSQLRPNITYGGFSTSNEMCFSFIYYYPRLSIEMMIAGPIYDTIPGHMSTHQLVKIVEGYDWTNATVRDKFQKDTDNSTVSEFCMLSRDRYSKRFIHLDEPNVPWKEPVSTSCSTG